MGKMSFACALTMIALVGCGGSDAHVVNPYMEDGTVARTSIESEGCGSRATLIELPEHCRWPESQRQSPVIATSANVVVDVDAEGKPRSARIVGDGASESDLSNAVVTCAMQGRYRAAWNGAGQTCPLTIRLARYASDVVTATRYP